MLQKLISYCVNFIKVVGSLVTGFTALFYATGFLAWNSRMVYLGMPEAEILDVNYLITGAQFFVSLPLRLIGGLSQLQEWSWTLWAVLVVVVLTAWLSTREYDKQISRWVFFATGILLLLLLLVSFREFFKHLPDPSNPGALFDPKVTQWEELADNYSRLIVFTILALVGTGLMLSWQNKIAEAISSEPVEKSLSGFYSALNDVREAFSNFIPLLVAIPTLIYIIMLPMNFVHPVFTKRYPVVEIRLDQAEIYREVQVTTPLFLFEQKEESTLLYSRESMRIWQVKKEHIKELSIVGHRSPWD